MNSGPNGFWNAAILLYEYLPFGGGVRRCIGMAFAQLEMKLVITGILSCFELALADADSVRPMRRGDRLIPLFRMIGQRAPLCMIPAFPFQSRRQRKKEIVARRARRTRRLGKGVGSDASVDAVGLAE